MTDFSSQLKNAYQTKVLGTLEKTVRAVAIVVDAALVDTTPVKTGRARANWLPSLNTPDKTVIPPVQEGQRINRGKDVQSLLGNFKLSDTILITNNLPYIRRLNEGSSVQAPAGFVDAALAKGKRAIKKADRVVK